MAMLKVPAGVAGKRPSTNPHVKTAGSIVKKRIVTHGGIVDPAGEIEQSVRALSGVGAGIASVWQRVDCLRVLDKRKEGKREQHKNETASPRQRPADGFSKV
jgi:hypothetical protein